VPLEIQGLLKQSHSEVVILEGEVMPIQPTGHESLVNQYFACLNETNAELRMMLIQEVWSVDGKFGTPLGEAQGYTAISALIEGVQSQLPGSTVRRTNPLDGFGSYLRFAFTIELSQNHPVIGGVDFGIVNNGKFELVMGFFDFVPDTDSQQANI
jgi:hypothetical protein